MRGRLGLERRIAVGGRAAVFDVSRTSEPQRFRQRTRHIVSGKLSRALLGCEISGADEGPSVKRRESSTDYILDESQRSAAHAGWDDARRKPAPVQRPVLVDAGPGTGKTRALVGRLIHLLEDRGIPPSRILALTYSNKAAEEIYSRVKAAVLWS